MSKALDITIAVKREKPNIQIGLGTGEKNIQIGLEKKAGTYENDYEKLTNLPQINGVDFIGNQTSESLYIVSENTSAGWNEKSLYVPKHGEICVFTDIAQIKIGDGSVPIIDLPFINQAYYDEIMAELHNHVNDMSMHVSVEDRKRWDNKLNYYVESDNLIFTRL